MFIKKKFDVGVVGLGYVGLTLATSLAEVGLDILGIEKHKKIVALCNKGIPHFSEEGLEDALKNIIKSQKLITESKFNDRYNCENYVITVGTPLDANGQARVDMIESATQEVAANMQDGALIILRSTVKIGTSKNIIEPILKKSGKSFELAMCPERTLEGKALSELRELPQIIGAETQKTRDRAAKLFRNITNTIVQVSSLETAETIKLVDNTYRDIQFAFANEVARACEAFNISAHEVIINGKQGYKRTNVSLPGLVGGPCLEKDTHIFVQSAKEKGVHLEISTAGRIVNERQPKETTDFIFKEMKKRHIPDNAKIAILGLAFKGIPETDDLRGSMSKKVIDQITFKKPNIKITLYDPIINYLFLKKQFSSFVVAKSLDQAALEADVIIITNNHPSFSKKSPRYLKSLMNDNGFIYDYWNHFSQLSSIELCNSYYAVGNISGKI
jgi:UDP-N-acetyl-D-mannosaminuronic acid dehydrogenase